MSASPRAVIHVAFHQPIACRIWFGSRPAATNASITGQKKAASADITPLTRKSSHAEEPTRTSGQTKTCRRNTIASTVRGRMSRSNRRSIRPDRKATTA